MAKYTIPPNAGKVRVAVTLGNKITVWNGKQGKDEFVIGFALWNATGKYVSFLDARADRHDVGQQLLERA